MNSILKCDESMAADMDNSRNATLLRRPFSINIYVKSKQESMLGLRHYNLPIIDLRKTQSICLQQNLKSSFKPSKSSMLLRMLRNKIKMGSYQLHAKNIKNHYSNIKSSSMLSKSLIYPLHTRLLSYSRCKFGKSLKCLKKKASNLSCGYLPNISPLSDKHKIQSNDADKFNFAHSINYKRPIKSKDFYSVLDRFVLKNAFWNKKEVSQKCSIIEKMYKKEFCSYFSLFICII